MRITCPSCQAAYEVPDSVLIPGRKVRCARCRATWAPEAAEAGQPELRPTELATVPVIEPTPLFNELFTKPAEMPDSGSAGRVRPAVLAGWAASFLLLGALGWSAVTYRQPIMRVWPPSQPAYAALGYR
jgi:predicted Zn finger-like uncharacterized protein